MWCSAPRWRAVSLPYSAGAQSLTADRIRGAGAAVGGKSTCTRDSGRDRCGAGRRPGGWPMAQSATLGRSRVGGWHHGVSDTSRPDAADHAASAVCMCGRLRRWSTRAPDARTKRCAARAPTCGWLSRSSWLLKSASASSLPRATACADVADVLAKREAAGDAAGFDRLRAEREVVEIDADRATAASERARAQAALAGFFASPDDVQHRGGAGAAHPTSRDLPPVDALVERAESTRGELLALAQGGRRG